MPWLIALNVLLYVATFYLWLSVGLLPAVICLIVAGLLSLVLSGGKFNPFDLF